MTVAVLSALIRPLVEGRLPEGIDVRWFASKEEAFALAPEAEIGWFDMYDKADMAEAVRRATKLKWLNSIYAGVDGMPLDLLRERGTVVTNGVGINALTIAEYVVMAMLVMAKGYREVARAQDAREWLLDAPGKIELAGSRALLLGAGAIGGLVRDRLEAFEVDVTCVRRSPAAAGEIGPDAWRERLPQTDWLILAVPATADTERMIGAAELAALPPTAHLINIARGSVVDQAALTQALIDKRLAGAWLDVTDPEPLPADDPLWAMANVHLSMHLSGRSQTKMFERSAARFLDNLARWQRGEPVGTQVDLSAGY